MKTHDTLELIALDGAEKHPALCLAFLQRAKPVDAIIAQEFRQNPDVMIDKKLRSAFRAHVGHIAKFSAYKKIDDALNFAERNAPTPSMREFFSQKTAAFHEALADKKAAHLLSLIGAKRTYLLLPEELRTESAAAYMHKKGLNNMAFVIQLGL